MSAEGVLWPTGQAAREGAAAALDDSHSAVRALFTLARNLMSHSGQADSAARALGNRHLVRLTIAAPPTTVSDVIAPFVAFAGEGGFVSNIREALPHRIYEELTHNRADIVVGSSPPPAQVAHLVVGHAPIWAQVPPDHKLAKRKSVGLKDLSLYAIAIVDDNHNVRRNFDSAMTQAGLAGNTAFETQSSHASQSLAASHRAICISSDDSRYGLVSLPIKIASSTYPLSITLYAAWDSMHYASAKIRQTVEELRVFFSKREMD